MQCCSHCRGLAMRSRPPWRASLLLLAAGAAIARCRWRCLRWRSVVGRRHRRRRSRCCRRTGRCRRCRRVGRRRCARRFVALVTTSQNGGEYGCGQECVANQHILPPRVVNHGFAEVHRFAETRHLLISFRSLIIPASVTAACQKMTHIHVSHPRRISRHGRSKRHKKTYHRHL